MLYLLSFSCYTVEQIESLEQVVRLINIQRRLNVPAGVFEEENENSISELIFKIQENLPEKKEKRH